MNTCPIMSKQVVIPPHKDNNGFITNPQIEFSKIDCLGSNCEARHCTSHNIPCGTAIAIKLCKNDEPDNCVHSYCKLIEH